MDCDLDTCGHRTGRKHSNLCLVYNLLLTRYGKYGEVERGTFSRIAEELGLTLITISQAGKKAKVSII